EGGGGGGGTGPEALDQPRAEQRNGRIAELLGRCHQVVRVAGIECRLEGLHQAPAAELFCEQAGVCECDALTAQRVLRGKHRGVDHQPALDVDAHPGRPHELQPRKVARLVVEPDVHDLVRFDEACQILAAVLGGDAGRAQDRKPLRPQKVGDEIRHGGARVDHGDVDVPEWRSHTHGTYEVDVNFRAHAMEVAQDRDGELYRKTRRHLHTQRALYGGAFVADVIECVLEAVE